MILFELFTIELSYEFARKSNSKVFCVERKEEKEEYDWESIRLNRDKSRDDNSKVHQLPGSCEQVWDRNRVSDSYIWDGQIDLVVLGKP